MKTETQDQRKYTLGGFVLPLHINNLIEREIIVFDANGRTVRIFADVKEAIEWVNRVNGGI